MSSKRVFVRFLACHSNTCGRVPSSPTRHRNPPTGFSGDGDTRVHLRLQMCVHVWDGRHGTICVPQQTTGYRARGRQTACRSINFRRPVVGNSFAIDRPHVRPNTRAITSASRVHKRYVHTGFAVTRRVDGGTACRLDVSGCSSGRRLRP